MLKQERFKEKKKFNTIISQPIQGFDRFPLQKELKNDCHGPSPAEHARKVGESVDFCL